MEKGHQSGQAVLWSCARLLCLLTPVWSVEFDFPSDQWPELIKLGLFNDVKYVICKNGHWTKVNKQWIPNYLGNQEHRQAVWYRKQSITVLLY